MRVASLSCAAVALAACCASAQAETRLLRHPSASANHVVFAYANDIWIASRDGGDARRLTTFEGAESWPHLSPDGTMVAFTGQYDGNTDVYVVPVEGGSPKRLTFHPGGDAARGWTADGKVLFASGRDTAPVPYGRFWTIGLDDAMPEALPIPRVFNGKFDETGAWFAYQQTQPSDIEWRNYRGGQAKPIWLLEMESLDLTKLPWEGSHDTDPVFLNGKVYFLSDRDFTVNIYEYDPSTEALRQITRHSEFDAKNLEVGGGVLVYEHAGYIRVNDPAVGRDTRLEIEVVGDFPWKRPQWKDVSENISSAALSPTGKRVVVEARGEIFTVPTEHGDWRNLSNSGGSAERAPAWSPNGDQIAWFSDASGEYQLMIADQDGLSPARAIDIPNPTFYYNPQWSPDGEEIMFTDESRTLWVYDLEEGEFTKVDADTYAFPQRTLSPVWSPDGEWIAYAKRLDSKMRAIMLYNTETGAITQVTDGMADAGSPAFDRNGKYLYFTASTNTALTTGWLDMSSYDKTVTSAVYAVLLKADTPYPFTPRSDEEEVKKADDDKADEDADAAEGDADADDAADDAADEAADDGEDAEDADEEDEAPSIDIDGIQQRIVALPMPERGYQFTVAGPEGVVFVAEASYALDARGLTLHRFSMEDRKAEPFMSGVFIASVSHDGKKLLYGAPGGIWGVVGTSGKANVGDGRLGTSGLRMKIDPAEEWAQIFTEAWRFHRDYFYVDNLHGADWDAVRRRWEPLVEHVSHRSDLAHLIDIVGGEIAVGHSFVAGGDTPDVDSVPGGLLGADYTVENGRYRIATILRAEPWNPNLDAPLGVPGLDVGEGDYIVGVNGVELTADTNIYSAFERTAGRQTRLHVNSEPTMEGARVVTVVPVGNEVALRQRAWMEANRLKVDEMSDGRLAYVWLPDTGGGGYTNFNRYYFAQQDRQGAIIDERFNGGGSAADYMVDIMARDLQAFFNNPIGDRKPFTAPQAGIFGPKVMIVNETAGSGGDMLPWLFRNMEIGPLVGTRTWGGLVGIWDYPQLIDGGIITIPRGGFYTVEGEWRVENEGVAPDIEVEIHPKDFAEGRDPQLERAVNEALRLLETEGAPTIVPEPPGPVRARRAQ
jgi:tricorn protease